MDVVFNAIDWVIARIPQPWGAAVTSVLTTLVLIAIVREAGQFFGLDLAFRLNKSSGLTLPSQSDLQAAEPRAEQTLSKDEVYRRVADGVIDRATAEWLFAQITDGTPSTKNAFLDTVERIGVAPEPGEKEALQLLANGDAKGAFERLSSVAAQERNPKLLQTLSALAAPVDPQLGAEAFTRFTVATESRSLANEDRLRLTYTLPDREDIEFGVITGDLAEVKGIDAWVSSENDWLLMARHMDKSISATVRYLAAKKVSNARPSSADGVRPHGSRFGAVPSQAPLPKDDPIQKALRPRAYRALKRRKLGEIIQTRSGELARTHGVKRIFHVVSVRAEPLRGVTPGGEPGEYIVKVVAAADSYNRFLLRLPFAKLRSIVIPLFGTGTGRLNPEEAADLLVDGLLRAANQMSARSGKPALTRLYLLAFASREYLPLRRSFEKRVMTRDIIPRELRTMTDA